jgi:methylenetetrahydrofolate reductase (NADPH)
MSSIAVGCYNSNNHRTETDLSRKVIPLFIREMYASKQPAISFEFFPPKSAEAESELLETTVPALQSLGASYFSITYGAGGGTRESTLRMVDQIRKRYDVEAVSHLTCSGATRDGIHAFLREAQRLGVQNILALRGDPPKGQTTFTPTDDRYAYALDLIPVVKQHGFCVGAACYPEGHVECDNKYLDWERTATKVEAGADFLITQLFYDWRDYLEMEDYLRNKKQVSVPIIPGVLPFLGAKQIRRFTSLCGARLSDELQRKLDAFGEDDESVRKLGVEVCTEICRTALRHGVHGIHFYCLNRTQSCGEVMRNLGLVKE